MERMDSNDKRESRRRYTRAVRMLKDLALAARIERLTRAVTEVTPPVGALVVPPQSPERLRRIGALAGSFNPLTEAHVALGAAARAAGQLDAIIWIVSAVTVNKERVERASVVDRLIQMSALVRGGPDGCALISGGLYVEQAQVIRALLPEVSELALIVGFDKVEQILNPRYYGDRDGALDELFRLATLLVAPRGADNSARLRALLGRKENRRYERYITGIPMPEQYRWDSSSEARAMARSQRWCAGQARALLAPEGLALARVAGVYANVDMERAGAVVEDAYLIRQRKIVALAASGGGEETL
jgi:nicotinamide-nucleotide adenylyltransferase